MKKIKEKARRRQHYLFYWTLRRNFKNKRWLRDCTLRFPGGAPCETIRIPGNVSISDANQREDLLNTISLFHTTVNRLSHVAGESHFIVNLDFQAVDIMYASGALLLLAELRNAKNIYGKLKLRCYQPRNYQIKQIMWQLGFNEIAFGVQRVQINRRDVYRWQVARGVKTKGKECGTIIQACIGSVAPALTRPFGEAISEAMTNTVQHAYIEEIKTPYGTRPIAHNQEAWWMFSYESAKHLSVVFCDLGHGIPNTIAVRDPALMEYINKQSLKQSIAESVSNFISDDAKIIESVISSAKTRTKTIHRGKGILKNIAGFIDKVGDNGVVRILSNHGEYTRRKKDNSLQKAEIFNHKQSINGTLIVLSVHLPEGVQGNA